MSKLSEWWNSDNDDRNGYERYLWAMVLGVLKEIGEEVAEELAAGLEE